MTSFSIVGFSRSTGKACHSNTKTKSWNPWKHANYMYTTLKALQATFDNCVLVKHHAVV